MAKKEGYKIDGISTYITSSEPAGGTVNVLVATMLGTLLTCDVRAK